MVAKLENNEVKLTARELEVLKLMAQGKTNIEIAKELIISSHTVKAHICNIFEKMHVAARMSAVLYALKEGIITYNSL